MEDKWKFSLIILLVILILGCFVYFNLNTFCKEPTLIEEHNVMDFAGMMSLDAYCPKGELVVGGGCSSDASRMHIFASSPIKVGASNNPENLDGWRCSFSQDRNGETNIFAYVFCE